MEERALPRVSLTGLKWSRSHTTAAVRRFCFSLLPCLMTRFISSSAMTESRRRALSLVLAGTLWFTTCLAVYGQGKPEYELPPVNYSTTTPHDAITGLRARFASGQPAFGGRRINVPFRGGEHHPDDFPLPVVAAHLFAQPQIGQGMFDFLTFEETHAATYPISQ